MPPRVHAHATIHVEKAVTSADIQIVKIKIFSPLLLTTYCLFGAIQVSQTDSSPIRLEMVMLTLFLVKINLPYL